ncbi:MAG: DUF1573 domain-containing protein [Flavobacteriaceae bacterium]|nr:DUF1573 domain-containing protein [Flavobacteriaceae bacterium]MBL4905588.1 DUF1573 domain-containing protein [Flavobacteriaceae bacterium]
MKKSLTLSLLIAVLVFVSCDSKDATKKVNKANLIDAQKRDIDINKGASEIKFDEVEYNYGTVTDGDIVEKVFTFTNVGKSDLIITNATSTCGCTVPTWPKNTPIPPGGKSEIKVIFNTAGKGGGIQTKTVTLFTNTSAGREFVKVTGSVLKKAI